MKSKQRAQTPAFLSVPQRGLFNPIQEPGKEREGIEWVQIRPVDTGLLGMPRRLGIHLYWPHLPAARVVERCKSE